MADENIREGANQNGEAHSAFLEEEELNEQLPDEFDADDRTALTAAHQGSDPRGGAADTAAGPRPQFSEDAVDTALLQPDAGPASTPVNVDGLQIGDDLFGNTPYGGDAGNNPAEALSATSLLNPQSSDETSSDDQSTLAAAHQGSRATSVPSDGAAAFDAGAQADLFGEFSSNANASSAFTSQSATDALAGDPGGDILDQFGLRPSGDDGNSAQSAGSRSATAVTGSSDGTAENAGGNAIGDLQPNGSDAAGDAAANGATNDSPPLDEASPVEVGFNSDQNDDGLGGSGDQSGGSAGSGDDDTPEYIADAAVAAEEGGKGGVNPIIGDRFDNDLVGTDGRDMINAQDGNDVAFGGAGDDLIMGKKGDDTLQGGLGNDTLKGGHGDDTFVFTNADFDGTAWTDVVDGQGQNGKPPSDYDTIDLQGVTQGWTLEVDGAGAGAEATNLTNPSQYTEGGGEFSGTITFDDGSTISFDNIEKIDW